MAIAKIESKDSGFDVVKWIIVVGLLVIGLVVNAIYASQPLVVRLAGWLILACIAVLVAARTTQGKRIWAFTQDARIELRKVVWPTRQETLQSTLIVILMVIVTALFLWGIDSVLLWLVGLLTGQKG